MALTAKQLAYHAARRNKTHCKRGHEFTPENTIVHQGSRHCRECLHLRMHSYRTNNPDKARAAHQAWRARNPDYKKAEAVCTRCTRLLPIVAQGHCQTCYLILRKEAAKTELLLKQAQRCAIQGCLTNTSAYTLKDWHLDHDHACGPAGHWCKKCIRGVLCKSCNAALGMVHDNLSLLHGLASYLGGVL